MLDLVSSSSEYAITSWTGDDSGVITCFVDDYPIHVLAFTDDKYFHKRRNRGDGL